MKNIWKIFTKDVKQLVKQPFALIIIIGLCVIPSLYAWFNILPTGILMPIPAGFP